MTKANKTVTGGAWVQETCSKGDLALLLDVSERTIDTWVKRGVIKRAARGEYLVKESIQNYLAELQKRAEETGATGKLADEKAKSAIVAREIAGLKLAKLKGETLTMEELAESWAMLAGAVRNALLTLPDRLGAGVDSLTAHDVETLRIMCRDILSELREEAEQNAVAADPDLLAA